MQNNILKTSLIVLIIIVLLCCMCGAALAAVGILSGDSFTKVFNPLTPTRVVPTAGPVQPTPTNTTNYGDPKADTPAELQTLFKPFWETWDLLHKNYVDQPLDDLALMYGALDALRAAANPAPAPTPHPTGQPIPPTPTVPPATPMPPLAPGGPLFSPFWAEWQSLHANPTPNQPDDLELMRAAISGMLAATGDKHTSYMDPDTWQQANEEMEGEYEGIGAWVDITGEYVEIVSPMRGSPAEAAGLRPRDVIIAINGEDQTGIPGDLVLKKILGPAGETIVLTVLRDGQPLDFSITRAKITVPVVDSEMLEGNIAYVALHTFNDQTTPQLRKALEDLLAQNPVGLIFDLRDNGGGYLVTAIEVVSEFIPKGVVMYEEYGDGTRDIYDALPGGRATEIPLVVLINEGTASASEITAGAIQDYGRGKLVGATSYGKGSVQNWIPLSTEEGGVRITIARWLTPHEKQINEIGLTPDFPIERTEEDYANDRDPQLDRAIQLLLQP